jgi:phosphopantothenoylcysteine decarboxylase / phosphopantothenate---cysteine ligase
LNVVLGVCGSIASYRAADLARELMRNGATVRVCLTDAASQFVTPLLFETLTGQPCLQDVFEEPERCRMAHIDWARSADLIVIAPASASTIAKLAHGIADDMLTTLVTASAAPILIAPAMNPRMYGSDANQDALSILTEQGATIIEPTEGDVASGEHGQGKLAGIPEIIEVAVAILTRKRILEGKRVLITSGPTQEPIDDVRYITNRSSGKMGAALARAALWMGAQVTVVAGPQRALFPKDASIIPVRTAEEMLRASIPEASKADVIIGAAAVADYRPSKFTGGKIRRTNEPLTLELTPNEDIIAALAQVNPAARVIGFAAEPTDDLTIATEKLHRKGLFAIAANDVSQTNIGFDADSNALTLLLQDGTTHESGRRSKLACALWLLEHVATLPAR